MEGSASGSVQIITDPGPGVPKSCGSGTPANRLLDSKLCETSDPVEDSFYVMFFLRNRRLLTLHYCI